MPQIEVCYSPKLFAEYQKDFAFQNTVIIDVLRATSTMIVGLAHGVNCFLPVSTIEEALAYKGTGWLLAGERNAQDIPGFDLSNSPLHYMDGKLTNHRVVITTTNGTQAIRLAADEGKQVILAGLINLTAVVNYLHQQQRNTLILCAGWKNKYNLEDSICAGGIIELCKQKKWISKEDSSLSAQFLFRQAQKEYLSFLRNSSHLKRLQNNNLSQDLQHCLQLDLYTVVPHLVGDQIIAHA